MVFLSTREFLTTRSDCTPLQIPYHEHPFAIIFLTKRTPYGATENLPRLTATTMASKKSKGRKRTCILRPYLIHDTPILIRWLLIRCHGQI